MILKAPLLNVTMLLYNGAQSLFFSFFVFQVNHSSKFTLKTYLCKVLQPKKPNLNKLQIKGSFSFKLITYLSSYTKTSTVWYSSFYVVLSMNYLILNVLKLAYYLSNYENKFPHLYLKLK